MVDLRTFQSQLLVNDCGHNQQCFWSKARLWLRETLGYAKEFTDAGRRMGRRSDEFRVFGNLCCLVFVSLIFSSFIFFSFFNRSSSRVNIASVTLVRSVRFGSINETVLTSFWLARYDTSSWLLSDLLAITLHPLFFLFDFEVLVQIMKVVFYYYHRHLFIQSFVTFWVA